jgi:hypothetical protein
MSESSQEKEFDNIFADAQLCLFVEHDAIPFVP